MTDSRAAARDAFDVILSQLPVNEEVSLNTPQRAADALIELTAGYSVDVPELCKTFSADGYDEIVAVTTPFTSLCEHHLLPFLGHAHVAYIPDRFVIGLSKIPRIVQAFARRLQIQERLTVQIADALQANLLPRGVMVQIHATHFCCTERGIRAHGTIMGTSVTRGAFRNSAATREEGERMFARELRRAA